MSAPPINDGLSDEPFVNPPGARPQVGVNKRGWLGVPHAIGQALRLSANDWDDNAPMRLAASIAYYAIFALAPLLLIVTALVGALFDPSVAHEWLFLQLGNLMGREGAATLDQIMTAAAAQREDGVLSAAVGAVALLVGATAVFTELNEALNRVLGIKGVRTDWSGGVRARFAGIGLVLAFGFLALVSLMLSTLVTSVLDQFTQQQQFWQGVLQAVDLGFTLLVLIGAFWLLLRGLPDRAPPKRTTWIGAILCAMLFTAGKYLIAIYLARSGTTSPYGAAGSFVALLVWVYWSALLMLLGAGFGRRLDEALSTPEPR